MTTPLRSLYVHVPFCQTICGYCDFYSEVLDRKKLTPLVDSLLRELDAYAARFEFAFETIFVGGGTPTTLPPDELRRLLDRLSGCAAKDAALEFTVEANPATVSPEIAGALSSAGVTRVSIGAQSFDPGELAVLDRLHQPRQVEQTVAQCRAAGLKRLNLDLIFAVPGQTVDSWRQSLDAAIALNPDHLSCYSLTYEKGTPLYDRLQSGQVRRLAIDLEADLYETTMDHLAAAGFGQYEISNYARPGEECRHNLTYWHNEPAAGIGPSAAGLVDGVRYRNVPDTAAYVPLVSAERLPRLEEERLSTDQRARETMMLGLRLNAGVDRRGFTERFGNDPADRFREPLTRHLELGLMECDAAIRLTRRGRMLADRVIADFL